MASLTVGSLFSGIGGIDLGLERAGHRIVWHSEIDKYATRVLAKHWPHVPNLGDITRIQWNPKEHYVDIIAGGYPCQPFSTAGKRKGKKDQRHLWPYFLNAIRALRPRYALMENVRGHLTLGFGDVLADLAACGYSAEWQVIPASAIGAAHRRDRLVVVAYAENVLCDGGDNNSRVGMGSETLPESRDGSRSSNMAYPDRKRSHRTEVDSAEGRQSALVDVAGRGETMADSDGRRLKEREPETEPTSRTSGGSESGVMADSEVFFGDGGGHRHGETFAESHPGLSDFLASRKASGSANFGIWQTEPAVGRMADGIPARVDRLRGLGNAVVPQLAELIGILISEHADN
jgi:DNA (cytosine-5)-methyltransferase 1